MRANPFADVLAFLTKPIYHEPFFMVVAFWAVALAGTFIAYRAWQSVPGQKGPQQFALWCVRFIVGAMWWQQAQWKFPTDIGGLRYWTEQMVQHAAFPIQSHLVKTLVLPVFEPFAYAVFALEMAIAVSLLLGLFVRVSGIVGGLFAINLWLGLYNAPQEWPWSYVFLALLMFVFAVDRYGRSLGLDAIRSRSEIRDRHPGVDRGPT